MSIVKLNQKFSKGLAKLGFTTEDELLFLTSEFENLPDPQINFHIEKAIEFKASAIYLRKQLNGSYKPQAFLFDYTERTFKESDLSEIQKVIWSSGEAPLACIFYETEIKILNCTTHIKDDDSPVYLIKDLKIAGDAHRLYNEQFAVTLKGGTFWEAEENKTLFKFQNSAYDKLIDNVRVIIYTFKKQHPKVSDDLINKIIVQSILIKYLEERIDDEGNKLLSNKYFKKYDNAKTFIDVLRKKGKFAELLTDLDHPVRGFNGNVFHWEDSEKKKLEKIDLKILADLLENRTNLISGQLELWRYFEFKYIPVELISRLYEEFLGREKQAKGLYFTPSHLAKLLVDECIPLKRFSEIDISNFTVMDPACGSGIFLVIAFKRLVQVWRLKNNMATPELDDLKKILNNLYGVDKESQAVQLASFSLCLALCHELKPIDIINKLKFDDLTENNLIQSDFFNCSKIETQKFDLIIGNPPFGTGQLTNYSRIWEYGSSKVQIPQGQIALKFLSDCIGYLKPGGLQCLIIKASGLLYNSTSIEYKKLLFSSLNVIQILDFTALGRNKALWDNGADVSSAAIFLRNEKPDFKSNILHLTFKRTRATKERIVFEIDDYDLHFINRQTAIDCQYIWKNNLLGGGRIATIIQKHKFLEFEKFLTDTNSKVGEGFKVGSKGKLNPKFIYELPTMPTEAISEKGIDLSQMSKMSKKIKFEKIPDEAIFTAPNLIIWENIGEKRIPIHLNKKSFSFQHKVIGISNTNKTVLQSIKSSFEKYNDFYRFFLYVTSGQLLVNLNTVILKTDLMKIPFIDTEKDPGFSNAEKNIMSDVNLFMQDFLRHGERSKAVRPIPDQKLEEFILSYGNEFVGALNEIYTSDGKKFFLTDVIGLDKTFIATVFRYKAQSTKVKFHKDNTGLNLVELSDFNLSKHLSVNRIIKMYPTRDTIVFVKPNQYRYWLSLNAYRDADKCVSDLTKLGH